MNPLPNKSYKIAFFATLALALYGAYSLFVEHEYPAGGWFCIGLGALGMGITLYQGATRKHGR